MRAIHPQILAVALLALILPRLIAADQVTMSGDNKGWVVLDEDDFVRVNGDETTLTWEDGMAISTGKPVGVTRSKRSYKNFELLIEWSHQNDGGNSGVFAWVPMSALEDLPPGSLPGMGIEIQMLDHGYKTQYEKGGKKSDWFSTNGDIFPVGKSTMKPFPPVSPNGRRSFPTKELSKGFGQWNHYYVRAINGEVRLWVNGEEVSGGSDSDPAEGYLCLEAEEAPIHFRNIRIRELP